MKQYTAVGFDQNRVERVYAHGKTISEAKENCALSVKAYLVERPDLKIDENFKIYDTTPHFF